MVFLMIKNTILSASLVLSAAVLTMSILAKADLGGAPVFAQTITPKMHLEEGIKAMNNGDNQGALMHLNEADKGLADSTSSSDQSAKMHLDEGIKAMNNGDNQGALMHLNAADKALGGSG
jgi:Flp pilus assembly protein TadD